jgi:anti-sigma factor RsiW
MKADTPRLPDLLLEQYALGELSAAEAARVDAVLASDPELRSRLDALRASDQSILEAFPPAEIASSIRRRMLTSTEGAASGLVRGSLRRGPRFQHAVIYSAAAVVLVMVGFVAVRSLLWSPASDDITRPKSGAPGLFIYKKTASGAVELADGDQAAQGDLLQIRYAASGARFGAIVSLDGRGSITWHLPPSGSSSMPSMPGAKVAPRIEPSGAILGSAYELDDAPSFERFFMISSDEEFDLAKVTASLRVLLLSGKADSASPNLPPSLVWRSFLLRKTGGP